MTLKTVTVLLVEDDIVDQMTVKRAFQDAKIANPMLVANDGVEALKTLRGRQVSRPYLILLDLNMPRMSGIEFLQELRKDPEHHRAVVFVLTTSREDEDRIKAYDQNVAGYIVKADIGNGFLRLVTLLEHYWRIVEFP